MPFDKAAKASPENTFFGILREDDLAENGKTIARIGGATNQPGQ